MSGERAQGCMTNVGRRDELREGCGMSSPCECDVPKSLWRGQREESILCLLLTYDYPCQNRVRSWV